MTTDYVVFEGGAPPPSTPSLMLTHQGEGERETVRSIKKKNPPVKKKHPPPMSQKVDIFISP